MSLPDFKWVFKMIDGSTILVMNKDVKRTLDRRGEWENPQVVYEIKTPRGVWRRYWPEDIASVEQVPVTTVKL